MFTDSKVQIASAVAASLEVSGTIKLQPSAVRSRQVCRTTDHPGHILREGIKDLSAAIASSHALRVGRKRRQILVPSVRKSAVLHTVDLVREFRIFLAVIREPLFPLLTQLTSAFADSFLKMLTHSIRHQKV